MMFFIQTCKNRPDVLSSDTLEPNRIRLSLSTKRLSAGPIRLSQGHEFRQLYPIRIGNLRRSQHRQVALPTLQKTDVAGTHVCQCGKGFLAEFEFLSALADGCREHPPQGLFGRFDGGFRHEPASFEGRTIVRQRL